MANTTACKVMIIGLMAGGLAACSGSHGIGSIGGSPTPTPAPTPTPTPTPPPPPPLALEDQISGQFGTYFRASANTDPKHPTADQLPGVNPVADPIPIP